VTAKQVRRSDLSFNDLRDVNVERCKAAFDHELSDWSLLEWAGAMAGEAGEAANMNRSTSGVSHSLQGLMPRVNRKVASGVRVMSPLILKDVSMWQIRATSVSAFTILMATICWILAQAGAVKVSWMNLPVLL
jgi:hypothetical protein